MDNICAHVNKRLIKNYTNYNLFFCNECNLIINENVNNSKPPLLLYKNYYKNEIPVKFNSLTESIVRLFRLWRALKIFTLYPRAKSILDIGSGRGYLLYYLKKYFHFRRTAGTQLEVNSYLYSKNELGLEMYNQDLLDLKFTNNNFDIVTMWHVFEHIEHPEEYLMSIRSLLNDNGKLIIEVPNYSSWTRKLTNKYWLGLDLKYHRTFFSTHTLTNLLKKNNFNVKLVHTFSLEYSIFISAQSIISLITDTDHSIFKYLQGEKLSFGKKIFHFCLLIILFPICFIINLILFFSKYGEVILIVATK